MQTAVKFSWLKWGAVACIVLIIFIGGILHRAANMSRMQDDPTENFVGQSGACNVSPEQAEKLSEANRINNTISKQMYCWYGSCYYDFETDTILVGLTENTKENQAEVLEKVGDTSVQFYECEYSYPYLEDVYYKLDKKRPILLLVGVESYNISVRDNRVRVYLSVAENNVAIGIVNALTDKSGTVVFETGFYEADC